MGGCCARAGAGEGALERDGDDDAVRVPGNQFWRSDVGGRTFVVATVFVFSRSTVKKLETKSKTRSTPGTRLFRPRNVTTTRRNRAPDSTSAASPTCCRPTDVQNRTRFPVVSALFVFAPGSYRAERLAVDVVPGHRGGLSDFHDHGTSTWTAARHVESAPGPGQRETAVVRPRAPDPLNRRTGRSGVSPRPRTSFSL